MGSNPGTGRYKVTKITMLNGGPLPLGPVSSGMSINDLP